VGKDDTAMPGASDQVSKVATTTVDALKSTPVVLALVLFNVLFMFLMAYVGVKTGARWDNEIARWEGLAKSCLNVTVKDKQL
jgi:hypothetical protein